MGADPLHAPAQAKYVVEPFFAAGGTDFLYHRITVEENPDMSYDVMGSFYTYLGNPGPLLVNNVGMQTHFQNAVSADADLSVVMPVIEFSATPTGIAPNYYGVEGTHWDWDGSGNAVLKPEYEEAFLSSDVPSPYVTEVGTNSFNFLTSIMGINIPGVMIFDGTFKPRYPLDPARDDEITRRTELSHNGAAGLETKNGISIGLFFVRDADLRPLQTLLQMLMSKVDMLDRIADSGINMNQGSFTTVTPPAVRSAIVVITVTPIIMIYPFLQRYMVKGLMIGAVEGQPVVAPHRRR